MPKIFFINMTIMSCANSLTIDFCFVESVQIIPLTILTNGNFVAALSNKNSTEFQKRASLIKAGVSVACLLINFGAMLLQKKANFVKQLLFCSLNLSSLLITLHHSAPYP